MFFGILGGFTAALFNSADYLFSARFLLFYKSPARLLVISSILMLFMSLPFLFWIFPFSSIPSLWLFFLQMVLASIFFLLGQGAFFAALRFFEASRLSSLLGLKIIVLLLIFLLSGGDVNIWQAVAVFIASASAVAFNWSGKGSVSWKGWLLLLMTLVFYSATDIVETDLICKLQGYSGMTGLKSSLATVLFLYTTLGLILLPGIIFCKPGRDEVCKAFPHSLLWLISQVFLLSCYAVVQPVFGNVILATRGIFSIIAGIFLPRFGLAALDSNIPKRLWIRRIIAALMMFGAIALYVFSSVR